MVYPGFGRNSGPGTSSRPETADISFPQQISPSPPFPRLPSDSGVRWGGLKPLSGNDDSQAYERPTGFLPNVASNNPRTVTPVRSAQVQNFKQIKSPPLSHKDEVSKNSRMFMDSSSDFPSGDKGYMFPYRARTPSPDFRTNLFVSGHHAHGELKPPSVSQSTWVIKSKYQDNNKSSSEENTSSLLIGDGARLSGQLFHAHRAEFPMSQQVKSPSFTPSRGTSSQSMPLASDHHTRSPVDYRDLDAPEEIPSPPLARNRNFSIGGSSGLFNETELPFSSSPLMANQFKLSSNDTSPSNIRSVYPHSATGGPHQSGQRAHPKHSDVVLPKRTRSPTLLSTSDNSSPINPILASDDSERRRHSQLHVEDSMPKQTNSFEANVTQQLNFPGVKRAKLPHLPSSDGVLLENSDSVLEIERELHSKAKRLARFKDELSQPVESTVRDQKSLIKKQYQSALDKPKLEDPTIDTATDLADRNVITDFESVTSASIVGLCPDMCPESERAERERKGDLDHYERLNGDRNLSSKFHAVKKYTRTAEREAELIRPMPVLQKTMDYLLNLLDQSYNERFLGLYNFLWDRMRAIRMDLRMQHIFDLLAINMLEQMIRLHILAMHELCEYTKGEGFSEGFDAHLNIEQMNKTSVELFQLYDDHRKKGIHVSSEREFRGYYALLKLDKHPGYKVEPAELSLDLAKMTSEMRQSPEVLFARDVARACRTGNFIAFFRLARRASYLQACLMHAHFSKLRIQALASFYSGLQINQGIPVLQVARWLGMEEENIQDLLEYYGFSVKEFDEPYMMKENALTNVDSDYPIKCSELVSRKRSKTIVRDVSSPSLAESYATKELKEFNPNGILDRKSEHSQFLVPENITQFRDQEVCDFTASLSPKGNGEKPWHIAPIESISEDEPKTVFQSPVITSNPFSSFLSSNSSENCGILSGNEKKAVYDSAFRNSFGRMIKPGLEVSPLITTERDEENRLAILPTDSVGNTPISHPMFHEHSVREDQACVMEEEVTYDDIEVNYHDQEVAKAKLKLILRIWKRRAAKKKELREHRQAEACAALSSLSIGPPIWQYDFQLDTYGMLDIDRFTKTRHEVQGRSWSFLNPSEVVAAKLTRNNPDANCLCWKMVLCCQEETAYEDSNNQMNEAALSAAGSWLHSKFMASSSDCDSDLLVSSPGLVIWRSWIPHLTGLEQTCCLSVVKSVTFQDLNNAMVGACALLFLVSENISLELQKNRLHDLAMSLPSGSFLPLLILSAKGEDEFDPSTLALDLGLHLLDKSRVSTYSISFLKDQHSTQWDGFLSDDCLRRGLEWLASESPQPIRLHSMKTRDFVISQLKSTLEILNEMNAYLIGPNHCVLAFNEALDRSLEAVAAAALANPTCWPCPEIDLLDKSSDECRAVTRWLPSRGWSTHARTETLVSALDGSKLPIWEDDVSWLSTGFSFSDDIQSQKTRLEKLSDQIFNRVMPDDGDSLGRERSECHTSKVCPA